jgi:uncharacterized protein (TIGR02246 family)
MFASKPEELNRVFEKAFNAGDLEALLALYEPGARLVLQSGEVAAGSKAIREALQGYLALKLKMSAENRYVIEADGTAVSRATWRLTGTAPDGKPIETQGSSVEVCRRQPDGSWRYLIDLPYGSD